MIRRSAERGAVAPRRRSRRVHVRRLLTALLLLPLAANAALPQAQFGGEWRLRYETIDAPDFGLNGAQADGDLLSRLLLEGDLRWGEAARVYAELGQHAETGRRGGPQATDRDDLDLQQGYVEAHQPIGDGRGSLRLGRQALTLGSSRLVSLRDGPNVRRAFDGIRIGWTQADQRVDAFWLRPVQPQRGVFDDAQRQGESFWGGQWTERGDAAMLEIYYLGLHREHARFAAGSGDERRHSLGLRDAGMRGAADWNFEAVWQFGDFADQQIRAWTLSSDSGWRFTAMLGQPRVGLKADIISGGDGAGNQRLRTFNALYPTPTYFSEASLIAPANLVDVQPSLTFRIGARASLLLAGDWLWKQSRADAVYITPTPLTPVPDSSGGPRAVGRQWRIEPRWQPSPTFELRAAFVHFDAGAALRHAGGGDVDFAMLSATLRFGAFQVPGDAP